MFNIRPVSPLEADVQNLVSALDAYQIALYGIHCCHLDSAEELIASGAHMLGAEMDGRVVAVGALKLKQDYAEMKRVFVDPQYRGRGLAQAIILALETHALDNGFKLVKLETGVKQAAAIALYSRLNYKECEAFGCYENNSVSRYMEKPL